MSATFEHVTDIELRQKLERVAAEHEQAIRAPAIPPEVDQYPRYVFSRATPERYVGASVAIRNCFDEDTRGGTIIEQVGRAYLVSISGDDYLVHEPDDGWEPVS